MTDDTRVELRLDASTAGEPIRGALTGQDGTPHPFVGWLGLAAEIERLLAPGERPRGPETV